MKVKRSRQKEFPAKLELLKKRGNREEKKEEVEEAERSQLDESDMIEDNLVPRSFKIEIPLAACCQVLDWRISYSFSICFV